MIDWTAWLRELAGQAPVAMVSVLASEGSAPRGAGTRMLVTAEAERGTIGGGQLEYRAIEQARTILEHPPGTWRIQDYPLGPLLGQCCGGRVRLLVEHVDPFRLGWLDDAMGDCLLVSELKSADIVRHTARDLEPTRISSRGERPEPGTVLVEPLNDDRTPVYLFGAGHVGQAIVRHGGHLPLRFAWFDTRSSLENLEGVTIIPEEMIERCVSEAPEDAAILILTHDHGLDYRLTRAALCRGPLAFIGLIGSKTKRARFLSRLEDDGVSSEARSKLTCPIGIHGVTGKEPDVIAIATLAQLLQLRARST